MRVLIACEYSARVRDAFRAAGHPAVSCDLQPTEGDPRHHYQGDVFDLLDGQVRWDLLIAFPPCTYLTVSNAWRWHEIADQREQALTFVRRLLGADVPRIAVENPKGAISTHIRPADQFIHPWWFGDPYQKQTGLWLKGLPRLLPEVTVKPGHVTPWVHSGSYLRRTGTHTMPGASNRPVHRSRTFPGIARAMAGQWQSRMRTPADP
jgi:hypothetical protein